jgi:hypothetical protein
MIAIANPARNEDVQQEFDSSQSSLGKSAADAQTLLLSFIRVPRLRAKVVAVDLERIGIALKQGLISLDAALAWLDELGLFDIVVQRPENTQGGWK